MMLAFRYRFLTWLHWMAETWFSEVIDKRLCSGKSEAVRKNQEMKKLRWQHCNFAVNLMK